MDRTSERPAPGAAAITCRSRPARKVVATARSGPYPVHRVRRITVLVLALIAVGPAAARASAWYRCAHDGVLRAACCCPVQTRHHATPGSDTRVAAACCCQITQLAARDASVRGAPPAAILGAPALPALATLAMPLLAAPIRVAAIERPREPRGPPAPLFVRHCSLLL